MFKKSAAVIGLLLLLLGSATLLTWWQSGIVALSQDKETLTNRPVDLNCDRILREIRVAKRIMTERESQALMVTLVNESGAGSCETPVVLFAPQFDTSPAETIRMVPVPPGGEPVTLIWILTPRQTGSFEVAVATGNQAHSLGITVKTTLGLTTTQAQILSWLATALGPMLTVPWWYEQWEKRRKTAAKEKEVTGQEAQEDA